MSRLHCEDPSSFILKKKYYKHIQGYEQLSYIVMSAASAKESPLFYGYKENVVLQDGITEEDGICL